VKLLRKLVGRIAQWLQEFFPQNLSGMNPPSWSCGAQSTHNLHLGQSVSQKLMIIRDLNLECIAVIPRETQPILIIDTNGELAVPITLQNLQAVARYCP
jgi:hypothetical protein